MSLDAAGSALVAEANLLRKYYRRNSCETSPGWVATWVTRMTRPRRPTRWSARSLPGVGPRHASAAAGCSPAASRCWWRSRRAPTPRRWWPRWRRCVTRGEVGPVHALFVDHGLRAGVEAEAEAARRSLRAARRPAPHREGGGRGRATSRRRRGAPGTRRCGRRRRASARRGSPPATPAPTRPRRCCSGCCAGRGPAGSPGIPPRRGLVVRPLIDRASRRGARVAGAAGARLARRSDQRQPALHAQPAPAGALAAAAGAQPGAGGGAGAHRRPAPRRRAGALGAGPGAGEGVAASSRWRRSGASRAR